MIRYALFRAEAVHSWGSCYIPASRSQIMHITTLAVEIEQKEFTGLTRIPRLCLCAGHYNYIQTRCSIPPTLAANRFDWMHCLSIGPCNKTKANECYGASKHYSVHYIYRGRAPDVIWPANKPPVRDHREHSSYSLYTCNRWFDGQFILLPWAFSRGCTAWVYRQRYCKFP